jgi:LAGLIDADG endonuclease
MTSICSKIADFFGVKLYSRTRVRDNKEFYSFMVMAHNLRSHKVVYEYFTRFPLLSSKRNNFTDWAIIHKMQLNKQHLTQQGIERCINIKNNFNNNRTQFDWSHLF